MAHTKPKFYQQCIIAVSILVKMFDSSSTLFQTRPRRRPEQLVSLDALKEMSKVEGTSELMQMLEQGEYGEEGEDELEEIEDEEEEQLDDEEPEESQPPSSDSYGSEGMSDINDLSSHSDDNRGSFDAGASYNADPMDSDENEDYGSSDGDSWEQGFYEI